MDKLFDTAVIELETVSPLFIKGKDIDYGEGMLKGKDKDGRDCVFLIDNDKLCEYIAEKGKVEEYVQYFVREKSEKDTAKDVEGFIEFAGIEDRIDWNKCAPKSKDNRTVKIIIRNKTYEINIKHFKYHLKTLDESFPDDYDSYKNLSLQYFLKTCNILPDCYEAFKRIAKGITHLPDESKDEKPFVKNALNKPFIPGSSIKGAIRNAILWKIMSDDSAKRKWLNAFVNEKLRQLESGTLRNIKKEKAGKKELKNNFSTDFEYQGKNLPQQSFIKPVADFKGEYRQQWQNANETLRDFFRIVKISDANFIDSVFIYKTDTSTVCTDGNQTYQKEHRTELECVSEGSKAQFKITIDQKMAERFFGTAIPNYLKGVDNLLKTVHEFFATVWNFEKNFFNGKKPSSNLRDRADTSEIYRFYSEDGSYQKVCFTLDEISILVKKFPELDKLQLPIVREGDNFIISIDDISEQTKTSLISIGFFEEILQKGKYLFRTGWGGGMMSKAQFLLLNDVQRQGVRNLITGRGSQTAPKSRCLAIENEGSDKAVSPLGWCSLKILKDGELPSIDNAEFKTHSQINKNSAEPSTPFQNLRSDMSNKSEQNTEKKNARKSEYQLNQEIKKAEWKLEGGIYKVKIKNQEQYAVLTGKNKPNPYQRLIDCVITELIEGIVKKVKTK